MDNDSGHNINVNHKNRLKKKNSSIQLKLLILTKFNETRLNAVEKWE